jgi:alginate O-acetyltransferase complex protein AlgI
MEFDSLSFLTIYLPLVLVLFALLKKEARPTFLVLAGLVFYAWEGEGLVGLFLIFIVVNYLLGRGLGSGRRSLRRVCFLASLAFNLGALFYFKYALFFLKTIHWTRAAESLSGVGLPLGLSFLVFQALSSTFDTYRRRAPAARNFVSYALYLSFFPKVLSGPIIPYRDFQAQTASPHPARDEDLIRGIRRFIFGLGKKVLLAHTLGSLADRIFALPAPSLTASLSWLGLTAFTLQIFFDFAGYTDMAIGLGLMLGFRLPENFNYPYMARSIADFWRRWHMSLTRWLQDYLFLPIAYAVSRRIPEPRKWGIKAEFWAYAAGTMTAFLACGLWHGANWTFIIWGGYFGLLLVIEQAGLRRWMKRRLSAPMRITVTLFLVMMGWVFFRSPDLDYALTFIRSLFGFGSGDGIRYYPALYLDAKFLLAGAAGIVAAAPFLPAAAAKILRGLRARASRSGRWSRRLAAAADGLAAHLVLLAVALACVLVLAGETHNPFLYFRF